MEHDAEFRAELAAAVKRAAYQQYAWLRNDPRPFSEETDSNLILDYEAEWLARQYTLRDQIISAIDDLKRSQDHARIYALRQQLAIVKQRITDTYKFLTVQPPAPGFSRALFQVHPGGGYFFGGRELTENYTVYAGFRCPFCNHLVMRTKRPIPFGQGRRLLAYSCTCRTYAIEPPAPGHCHAPVTATFWQELPNRFTDEEEKIDPSRI